ncbi:MAG: hypothetical protein AB1752_13935 [Candidatus Zixiibacteriota bacterium]
MLTITRWLAISTLVALVGPSCPAQTRPDGNWEFALLGGLSLYGHESVRDGETGVAVPHGGDLRTIPFSSSLRVTYWTRSPITLEFGLAYLHEEHSVGNAEAGFGVNLLERSARFQPFVSLVLGVWWDGYYRQSPGPLPAMVVVDRDDGLHTGLTVGARYFVRDHACLRLQTGLRKASFRDESVLEVLTGLGFFL